MIEKAPILNTTGIFNPEEVRDYYHQYYLQQFVKWIRSHQLIKPDKDSLTQFAPFYQIEESELKEAVKGL